MHETHQEDATRKQQDGAAHEKHREGGAAHEKHREDGRAHKGTGRTQCTVL